MGSSLQPGEINPGHSAFPTTHWSIVLRADGQNGPQATSALEHLCGQYWYPIYGFIRRQGRAHHEAEDLAQSFFAQLLANEGIARARPDRGRFRTFLLSALRNFMTNEWHRARAAKRGGGETPVSLEFGTGEERFTREAVDAGLTPEQAFDRSWALGVIEKGLTGLREEYERSGRGALFTALAPLVWGGSAPEPHAIQAQRLGLNETALKVALHRLRKRLRERLQQDVASTVANEADVASELRHLITSVGGSSPPL